MSDKSQRDAPDGGGAGSSGMKIDIGQVSAAGHVVIAGRDAHVSGSTRGDGNENQVVIIGGVEATPKEAQELRQSLDKIDKAIETANLEPAAQAAAQRNAVEFKQQITAQTKPNEHLLVQAAQALFDFGPDIAGAVVSAFMTPLAGKIVAVAGERALRF
jgi:hypothetical protein